MRRSLEHLKVGKGKRSKVVQYEQLPPDARKRIGNTNHPSSWESARNPTSISNNSPETFGWMQWGNSWQGGGLGWIRSDHYAEYQFTNLPHGIYTPRLRWDAAFQAGVDEWRTVLFMGDVYQEDDCWNMDEVVTAGPTQWTVDLRTAGSADHVDTFELNGDYNVGMAFIGWNIAMNEIFPQVDSTRRILQNPYSTYLEMFPLQLFGGTPILFGSFPI